MSPQVFEECLSSFGLFPKKTDLQALIKYYGDEQTGLVNCKLFIESLREELSHRKRKIVEKAFDALDVNHQG